MRPGFSQSLVSFEPICVHVFYAFESTRLSNVQDRLKNIAIPLSGKNQCFESRFTESGYASLLFSESGSESRLFLNPVFFNPDLDQGFAEYAPIRIQTEFYDEI